MNTYPYIYLCVSICLFTYICIHVAYLSILLYIYIYPGFSFDIDWEDRKLQVPYIHIYMSIYLSI